MKKVPKKEITTHNFSVRLTDGQFDKVNRLARQYDVSSAAVFKWLLENAKDVDNDSSK